MLLPQNMFFTVFCITLCNKNRKEIIRRAKCFICTVKKIVRSVKETVCNVKEIVCTVKEIV